MSTSVNCSSESPEISYPTPLKAIQPASPWLQLVSRRISNAAQARSICPGLRGGNTFYEDIFDWGRSGWWWGGGGWVVGAESLQLKIARDGCSVGPMVYSSRGLVQVSWSLRWGRLGQLCQTSSWSSGALRRKPTGISRSLDTSASGYQMILASITQLKHLRESCSLRYYQAIPNKMNDAHSSFK